VRTPRDGPYTGQEGKIAGLVRRRGSDPSSEIKRGEKEEKKRLPRGKKTKIRADHAKTVLAVRQKKPAIVTRGTSIAGPGGEGRGSEKGEGSNLSKQVGEEKKGTFLRRGGGEGGHYQQ